MKVMKDEDVIKEGQRLAEIVMMHANIRGIPSEYIPLCAGLCIAEIVGSYVLRSSGTITEREEAKRALLAVISQRIDQFFK